MGLICKNFGESDDVKEFQNAKVEIVDIDGIKVRRLTCRPGWVWSQSVGPSFKSDRCPLHHSIWIVTSGRFAVQMHDGTTAVFGPGDIGTIPPDHDAWVVGDEPVVGFDFLSDSIQKRAA